MTKTDILICGAGPAGLGAAWRLEELSQTSQHQCDWLLSDAADVPGGMAVSEQKDGFTWDLGGHVLFPHYEYFENVLNEVIDSWVEVKPVRGAWMFDQFVPYPVQRNIRHFPPDVLRECLQGLTEIAGNPIKNAVNFEQHLKASFGDGLYENFFEPLNKKMWGTHPAEMSVGWTQHRSGSKASNVPTVDLQKIIDNIEHQRDDLAWSEDTRISYPATNGTGAIWQGVASRLPADRLHFNQRIVSLNTTDRIATTEDGKQISYKNLFSSMPIDKLLTCLTDRPDLSGYAHLFKPAVVDVVGIGVQGACPSQLKDICSIYLPDEHIAFWRASVLSNYSPTMAPSGCWSILCEINSGPSRSVVDDPIARVIEGLEQLGFLTSENIISRWHRHLPYGYPVPTLERDTALHDIQRELNSNGIFSRGRFGGWKYEVCNQDHAFMQGVEVINALLTGEEETTYTVPLLVDKNFAARS